MLEPPWQLGLPLVFLQSLSAAVALLSMKASSDIESHLPLHQRRRWVFGFVILVVNAAIIDLIVYSITPLAIIAPFSALTIVWSTMLAQSGLFSVREVLTWEQVFAIAVVCVGVSTVSLTGPHSFKVVTQDNVQNLLYRKPFAIFAAVSVLGIAAATGAWATHRLLPEGKPLAARGPAVALVATGAASCGSLTQVALKVVALAGKGEFYGGGGFFQLHMVLGLLGLVVFAPLQLVLLNAALAWSPASFAVTIYQAMLVVLTIVGGGAFFKEFGTMTSSWMAGFLFGLSLSIGGLVLTMHAGGIRKQEKAASQGQTAEIRVLQRQLQLWNKQKQEQELRG